LYEKLDDLSDRLLSHCTLCGSAAIQTAKEVTMDELIYYCPQCGGKVLYEDEVPIDADANHPPSATTLYCPQCEMLVHAIAKPASEPPPPNRETFGERRGRTREMGSNAGGGQRGDLSDQGATQWNVDPNEGERNTWQDKDKRA
jgi:predicted RNA-binding Zn-ribbon protein involved in translation (DUF1610 family)